MIPALREVELPQGVFPRKDFVPISLYVKSPFILVLNPALGARSVPELIKLAKESKEPLSYSTPGTGTVQHLAVELMKQKFGLDITHVPYKNSTQSVTDIMAGHVSMAFAEAGLSLPQIRDGKLRALAVSWHVLLAPAGTPSEIVNRLQQELKRILAAPEMQQRIATLGLLAIESPSSDGIEKYMRAEREKWGAVVKSLGLVGSQ